jgi:hypothetical protein
VLKVSVTARQIEEEFTWIVPSVWRWTTQRVADNMFIVRFPDAQLIQEWGWFNPISMRSVKAKLQIDPWNGVVGAKAELQEGWFRVRGIPYDKRCPETIAYVGSLVGATKEVDESTLHRTDYVRIKIATRDVTKVSAIAEGEILPFLYDFAFLREVTTENQVDGNTIRVPVNDKGTDLPSNKKPRQEEQSGGATQMQIEVYQPKVNEAEMDKMKQSVSEIPKAFGGSISAPSKDKNLEVKEVPEMEKVLSKMSYKEAVMQSRDLELLSNKVERVHALSRASFNTYEDDLSEEDQGSQSNTNMSKDKQHVGLVRCSNLVHNISSVLRPILEEKTSSNDKVDDVTKALGVEDLISEKETILDTRCSSRIQVQLLEKMEEKKHEASKKRSLESTNMTVSNSFAILDNANIASLLVIWELIAHL